MGNSYRIVYIGAFHASTTRRMQGKMASICITALLCISFFLKIEGSKICVSEDQSPKCSELESCFNSLGEVTINISTLSQASIYFCSSEYNETTEGLVNFTNFARIKMMGLDDVTTINCKEKEFGFYFTNVKARVKF